MQTSVQFKEMLRNKSSNHKVKANLTYHGLGTIVLLEGVCMSNNCQICIRIRIISSTSGHCVYVKTRGRPSRILKTSRVRDYLIGSNCRR